MAPPEKLKIRNGLEAELTKQIKKLRRRVNEKSNAVAVRVQIKVCSDAYDRLEEAHYAWVDYLQHDLPDQETAKAYLTEVDKWLSDKEKEYDEIIQFATDFAGDAPAPPEQIPAASQPQAAAPDGKFTLDLSDAMAEKLQPQTYECMTFTDDPRDWKLFTHEFKVNILNRVSCESKRVSLLLKHTQGKSKACVKPHITSGSNTPFTDAWKDVESLFGTPAILARHILNDLKDGPSVVSADELLEFARSIKQAVDQLAGTPHESDIKGHAIIDDLLVRLSNSVHQRWSKTALKHKVTHERYPDINDFLTFIKLLAAESNDEYYGIDASKRRSARSTTRFKDKRPGRKNNETTALGAAPQEIHTAAISASFQGKPRGRKAHIPEQCLFCNSSRHDLTSCRAFLALEPSKRWGDDLSKMKVCWKCLSANCRNVKQCVPNNPCQCGMPYHFLLHVPPCVAQQAQKAHSKRDEVAFVKTDTGFVVLPVAEVIVEGIKQYALCDPASTATFIDQRLVDRLKLKTYASDNETSTIVGTSPTNNRVVKSFRIKAIGSNVYHTVTNAYVCSQVPASTRTIPISTEEFPYLQGLPLAAQRDERVGLLIGCDTGLVHPLDKPREHPTHPRLNPTASKCRLGWTISGPLHNKPKNDHVLNECAFISCRGRSAPERLEQIESDIRQLYEIEREDNVKQWSVEDKMVYQFWEDTIKVDEHGHYELPIPFKDTKQVMPDNRPYALRRLNSLEKKLEKVGISEKYQAQFQSMIDDGFMELVPVQDLERSDGRVWYLPHFDVIKPDKPGKIRIVMDAKCEFEGVCLNKLCYQGPDLCNKLFDILLRFREYYSAWSADVKAMYLQVRIPRDQRDMLRVLWKVNGRVVEYRMTSHIFGGIWCSASSTFALRRAAQDAKASQEVMNVVNNAFYVDDALKSVLDAVKQKREPADTRDALIQYQFQLTKFQGTREDLLQDISPEERASPIKTIESEDHTKALGLHWNMSTDEFYYDRKVLEGMQVTSRRTLLSATAKLYDPIGLLAPIIVTGKLIFQRATQLKLDWDAPLPVDLRDQWEEWYAGLENLQDLRFPRAMLRENIDGVRIEIHHFSDASEKAYGCAAYIRAIYPSGEITVNLLCAKGRVAPISLVTIPRLELMSAHLAAKIDVVLRQQLTINIASSHFWSDSTVTLHYIRNTTLRLQTFVANRVGFIHNNTPTHAWHHVRTDVNVADIISRGVKTVEELPLTWINGPTFLSQEESLWPPEVLLPQKNLPLEIKCNAISALCPTSPDHEGQIEENTNSPEHANKKKSENKGVTPREHPLDTLINYFSSSRRLFLAVSWWRRVCSKEVFTGPISVDEMKKAEETCVRHVQASVYKKEIAELDSEERQVNTRSELRSLSPILFDGIICVGGRLKHADPDLINRHPAILPRKHHLSYLILRRSHLKAHLGTEWTLSMLRQDYWIIGARHSLRHIRSKCSTCHRYFSTPKPQLMADLPAERCQQVQFAFTNSGVDLFGPFYVKFGRGRVKRWVTLFTCFAIRAIHLEVVHSMSADSFVMALQRFAARRGLPVTMRSDNGTNIVGAESELSAAWDEIDTEEITVKARSKGIDWKFNAPKASEMGGVWERQIRTVRKCLSGILNPKTALDDEVLYTSLCEVENLVNSRPITKVSQDPEDGVLTPNHLLLMKSNASEDHMEFNLGAIYRRNWKKVCMLRDQFWNKWSKEYLLNLQIRQKWDKKQANFKEKELVLLVEANLPRSQWQLGIIDKVISGRDGLVRELDISTEHSSFRRPVTKVVKLELE